MDNVERLMEFGPTRHEANLYILLTLKEALTDTRQPNKAGFQDRTLTMHWQFVDKGAQPIQEEDTVRYTGSDRRILQ